MARVAFIGLGTMGLPMARNLVRAGHDLVACDRDPLSAKALGAPVAATPADAVAGVEAAITSLPSPAAVEEVVLARNGIVAGAAAAAPGLTVIDMSTGPPALARRLAAELAGAGLACLDAPVSGGPHGAEAGTLTVMVGGSAETFDRWHGLLSALGDLVVHVGGPGTGQVAKLCNNLVVGATMAALAESCELAEREGIEARTLYGLLTRSTGDSRVLRVRFPLPGVAPEHPASRGYEPLFALDLMAKDLDLALELAAERGVATPVATAARDGYRHAQEDGLGALDYSAVYLAKAGRAS